MHIMESYTIITHAILFNQCRQRMGQERHQFILWDQLENALAVIDCGSIRDERGFVYAQKSTLLLS